MKNFDAVTKAWLAKRKEAAKAINPGTAKLFWEYGQVGDPYGVYPNPAGEGQCIGRNYFAHAPGSDICVSFHDLPKLVVDELRKRLERNDPDGPSPFDPDLPNVDRMVIEIMARDEGEPGYAAAVARGITTKLAPEAARPK